MSATIERFTKPGDGEWVVIRFVYGLKVTATFIGPNYSVSNLVNSGKQIWQRFLGVTVVPLGFFERLFPLMKAVATSRSVVIDGHMSRRSPCQPCYPFRDNALYELVSITVVQRWFGDCSHFSIPFEYVELAGYELPDENAVY